MATTDADSQLKARHRAMWAAGDYRVDGRDLSDPAQAAPGRSLRDRARHDGPRRRRRHRQRRDPGRARRRAGRDRERPHAGAAGGRQTARRGGRRRAELGRGRRRGAAVRRRVVRLRDLVDRRDVRARPPADRRRAGARLPSGRHDRPAELDAGGDDRRPLPHFDRPVRAPAAARRQPPPLEAASSTCASCSATGSSLGRVERRAGGRRLPGRARLRRSTSAPATARRSQPRPTPAETAAATPSPTRSTASRRSGTERPRGPRPASRWSTCSPSRRALNPPSPGRGCGGSERRGGRGGESRPARPACASAADRDPQRLGRRLAAGERGLDGDRRRHALLALQRELQLARGRSARPSAAG